MSYQSKRPASKQTLARRVGAVATTLALLSASAPAAGVLTALNTTALADSTAMKPGLYIGDDKAGTETLQKTGEIPLYGVGDEQYYMYYASEDGKTEFGVNLFTEDPSVIKAYYDAEAKTLDVVQVAEKTGIKIGAEFKVWKDMPGGEVEKLTELSPSISLEELKSIDGKRCSLDIYVWEARTGMHFGTEDGEEKILESGELPESNDKQWVDYYNDDNRFGIRFDGNLVKAVYDADAATVTFSAKNAGDKVKVEALYFKEVGGEWEDVTTERLPNPVKLSELKPADEGYQCDVRADIDRSGLFLHTHKEGGEDTYQSVESGTLPDLVEDQSFQYQFADGKRFNLGFDVQKIRGTYDEQAGTLTFTSNPAGWKMVANWRAYAWQTEKTLEEKELATGDGTVTLKVADIPGLDDEFIASNVFIDTVGDAPETPLVPLADPEPDALKTRLGLWTATGHAAADFQHWVDLGLGPDGDTMWATYDANGELVTNRWLNFTKPTSDGTGYRVYTEDWYYVDGEGKMLVGFQTLKFGNTEETYYFNPVHDGTYGKMLAGWHTIDGVDYYFSEVHDGTYGKLVKDARR